VERAIRCAAWVRNETRNLPPPERERDLREKCLKKMGSTGIFHGCGEETVAELARRWDPAEWGWDVVRLQSDGAE